MSRIAAEVLTLSTIRPQLPEYNQVSAQTQLMTERIVSGEMTPLEAIAAYNAAVTQIAGEDDVIRIPLDVIQRSGRVGHTLDAPPFAKLVIDAAERN
jgi:hypothetical protein